VKNIQEAMVVGKERLAKAGCSSPALDVEILLCHVLKVERLFLYTWPNYLLLKDDIDVLESFILRRESGEPIAYIVGIKEFYNRRFKVNQDVLIPRPDTEKLIETALLFLPFGASVSIIDVCTGSGCIGIILALERPEAFVVATDISLKALKVAADNIEHYQLGDRVSLKSGDLLESCQNMQNVDLIVANPPYIKAQAMPTLMGDVYNFEPHVALLGEGVDGLSHHKRIVETGINLLRPGGRFILEIGYDQKPDIEMWAFDKQLKQSFIKDDADHIRLVIYEKPGVF
jgi:release factor glutamine methyltransferase